MWDYILKAPGKFSLFLQTYLLHVRSVQPAQNYARWYRVDQKRYSPLLLKLMTLDSEPARVLIQQTEAQIWSAHMDPWGSDNSYLYIDRKFYISWLQNSCLCSFSSWKSINLTKIWIFFISQHDTVPGDEPGYEHQQLFLACFLHGCQGNHDNGVSQTMKLIKGDRPQWLDLKWRVSRFISIKSFMNKDKDVCCAGKAGNHLTVS